MDQERAIIERYYFIQLLFLVDSGHQPGMSISLYAHSQLVTSLTKTRGFVSRKMLEYLAKRPHSSLKMKKSLRGENRSCPINPNVTSRQRSMPSETLPITNPIESPPQTSHRAEVARAENVSAKGMPTPPNTSSNSSTLTTSDKCVLLDLL